MLPASILELATGGVGALANFKRTLMCVGELNIISVAIHYWALQKRSTTMLHYTIVFLVIALIAGVLGFGGIAGSAMGIAKILFFIFLILFVISLLIGKRGV